MHKRFALILLVSAPLYCMEECKEPQIKKMSPQVAPLNLEMINKKHLDTQASAQGDSYTDRCEYMLERFESRRVRTASASLSAMGITPRSPEHLEIVQQEVREFQASPNIECSPDAVLRFKEAHQNVTAMDAIIVQSIKVEKQRLAAEKREQNDEQATLAWCCFGKK